MKVIHSYVGEGNSSFCNLLEAFLKTQILDKEGNDYSCKTKTKGIPQGCSVSPVLMNVFLHQLDLKIKDFMNQEDSLYYVRYADDMIKIVEAERRAY